MHLSSIDKMTYFRHKYLSGKEASRLRIVDLGSMEIGGSYRSIFDAAPWQYMGIDVLCGKNVDLVLSDPYNWLELETDSVDVLVSGQTFEHVEYFWRTMLEIARVLRPGGLSCIIAPSGGPVHRYPVDCWRFYPDGFSALARFADLEIVEVTTQWEPKGYADGSDMWADTMLVAKKPQLRQKDRGPHIYVGKVDGTQDDSLGKIARHLLPDKDVLELGPATGYLTEYLKKMNCRVDCVELSPEMAESARKFCRRMLVADLDQTNLEEHFGAQSYDFIVIADVLEHLKAGEKTLRACWSLLKPEGKLLLSVPNIAHTAVVGGLMKGKFEYRDEGLLDQTHLRFFTRESIVDLLQECRFSLEAIETVERLPEDTEMMDSLDDLPVEVQHAILEREDSLTFQFVIVATPHSAESGHCKVPAVKPGRAIDLRRSYIMSLNKKISELDTELARAQQLAYERSTTISELTKDLHEVDTNLAIAQRWAYERLDKIVELDAALAVAQKLAIERFDTIDRLHEELRQREDEIHTLKTNPIYWARMFLRNCVRSCRSRLERYRRSG